MHWSIAFFAFLFLFATSSIGKAELLTDDLAALGSDSTEQGSPNDWLWEDAGVDVLDTGNSDMFSLEGGLDVNFAEASGPDMSGYNLFTMDEPEVPEAPSVQTALDLMSLSQESPPEECLVDGVAILYKRSDACPVNLSKVKGRDPGLCPKFMNNIKIITCCCENAVEYDPETYPDFSPCFFCKYDGFYLDLKF